MNDDINECDSSKRVEGGHVTGLAACCSTGEGKGGHVRVKGIHDEYILSMNVYILSQSGNPNYGLKEKVQKEQDKGGNKQKLELNPLNRHRKPSRVGGWKTCVTECEARELLRALPASNPK